MLTQSQIVIQSNEDVRELVKNIDLLVDKYLMSESKLESNQKIVNVGRALNAYHVAWITNLTGQTDQLNNEILLTSGTSKTNMPFTKPSIQSLGDTK